MKKSKIILDMLNLKCQLDIHIEVPGRKLETRGHLGPGDGIWGLAAHKDMGLDEAGD